MISPSTDPVSWIVIRSVAVTCPVTAPPIMIVRACVEHFHGERNHQGKGNLLLFPQEEARKTGPVRCRERLGGLLKFYLRAAA